MSCPKHGLTLASTLKSILCPRQVLHWLSSIGVGAMSQTGLTLAGISRGRFMSHTCLTLALVSMQMHVLEMSYTGSHNVADACLRHVLH